MKLQNLNRSLVKILAAVATLFLISLSAVAQGQRGQWGTDGCYYAAVVNRVIPRGQPGYVQWVRQGCNFQTSDGDVYYHDDRAQTWKNMRTGMVFAFAQNGRLFVLTNTGWVDGAALVEKARADRLAAPTPTAAPAKTEKQTADEQGSMLLTQGLMKGLIKSMQPNSSLPTPLPLCNIYSTTKCSPTQ
jgi:hypothetical protein